MKNIVYLEMRGEPQLVGLGSNALYNLIRSTLSGTELLILSQRESTPFGLNAKKDLVTFRKLPLQSPFIGIMLLPILCCLNILLHRCCLFCHFL